MENFQNFNKRRRRLFRTLEYRIPEYASSTRLSCETVTIDWNGYADDLILAFDAERSLANKRVFLSSMILFKNTD